ncbi:MAG: hypothetical protein HYV29_03830 [Ignavibacteriales bacterium]|nr:hypothetical protein [Ignavibacteriales bacterium]
MIVCTALSLSGNKRGKENIPDVINQGNGSYSLDKSAAASSPWLPVNLDLPTSQYRLVEYANGAVWFAGARTTAPLVGNYYGYRSKDSGKT